MSWTHESKLVADGVAAGKAWRARARTLLGSLVVGGCVTLSNGAWAQARSGDAAMAQTLFDEAKRKMAAGDYAGACPKLAESYRLDPGGGTLTALAVCHESWGKTASAWTEFIQVVNESRQTGRSDRQKFAQQHVDALEPKLSKLTVVVDPATASAPGVEVRRDGTVLGQAGWGTAAPLDPGPHLVEVSAPGKKAWSAKVTLGAASDEKTVTVPALEDAPSQSSPSDTAGGAAPSPSPSMGAASSASTDTAAAPEDQEAPSTGNARRTIAYVVGGAAVVSAALGTYFGLQAVSKAHDANQTCPSNACASMDAVNTNNDAKSAALAADLLLGTAVVAGGVAVYLYLSAPSGPSPAASTAPSAKRTLRIAPVASAHGGAIVLGGTW